MVSIDGPLRILNRVWDPTLILQNYGTANFRLRSQRDVGTSVFHEISHLEFETVDNWNKGRTMEATELQEFFSEKLTRANVYLQPYHLCEQNPSNPNPF